MARKDREGEKTVASNRKARHDYAILETFEAGVALTGDEVKSLRGGRASLAEAFARVRDGEVWLEGMHIPPYEQGDKKSHLPLRPRKLLLHRQEISKLADAQQQDRLALVPLRGVLHPRARQGRARTRAGPAGSREAPGDRGTRARA